MEFKSFAFEVKAIEEDGTFDGYAAVFGNVDSYGDVIEPGAFAKTLRDHKAPFPILWQHDPYEPIGASQQMSEDSHGLHVQGKLTLAVQRAQEARALMTDRALTGLSIGYEAVKSGGPTKGDTPGTLRRLKEIKLWEFSPVTFPANDLASVTTVKSLLNRMERGELTRSDMAIMDTFIKGAQSAPDFGFAERDASWDAEAAEGRWRSYTKADDGPNADYAKGFLWQDTADGETPKFGDFKLLIVDVMGGTPKIVPRAVFAVAAVLSGSRGGADIPQADQDKIKSTVSGLYGRMAKEFNDDTLVAPWSNGKSEATEFVQRLVLDLKEGRVLSSANRQTLSDVADGLEEHAGHIRALLDATDPSKSVDAGAAEPTDEPDIEPLVRALRDITSTH